MMWVVFMRKIKAIALLLLLSWFCVLPESGWCMTTTETDQYMKVPIAQWQTLTSESKALSNELIEYKSVIQRLKKPSAELLSQLEMAEKTLLLLQTELTEQKKDLMLLSKDKDELKISLQTLKQQITKERKIHKRQIWQNRIWCVLIGCGVGYAASK